MNRFRRQLEEIMLNIKDVEELALFFSVFKEYCNDLVTTRTGLSIRGVDGAPDWYGYERIIWDSSFKIVEPILKIKKHRGENAILDGLATMCLENIYGKGRQSFIMLLGKYGGCKYISVLASLIDDPEVSIHVIEALTRMNDLSQYEKIKSISEGARATPERSYARKYIKKRDCNLGCMTPMCHPR